MEVKFILFQLREEFDTYGEIDWVNQSNAATVHDVAALMKCFLRELPDGLLSKELYHPLIATTSNLHKLWYRDYESLFAEKSLLHLQKYLLRFF